MEEEDQWRNIKVIWSLHSIKVFIFFILVFFILINEKFDSNIFDPKVQKEQIN